MSGTRTNAMRVRMGIEAHGAGEVSSLRIACDLSMLAAVEAAITGSPRALLKYCLVDGWPGAW